MVPHHRLQTATEIPLPDQQGQNGKDLMGVTALLSSFVSLLYLLLISKISNELMVNQESRCFSFLSPAAGNKCRALIFAAQ